MHDVTVTAKIQMQALYSSPHDSILPTPLFRLLTAPKYKILGMGLKTWISPTFLHLLIIINSLRHRIVNPTWPCIKGIIFPSRFPNLNRFYETFGSLFALAPLLCTQVSCLNQPPLNTAFRYSNWDFLQSQKYN